MGGDLVNSDTNLVNLETHLLNLVPLLICNQSGHLLKRETDLVNQGVLFSKFGVIHYHHCPVALNYKLIRRSL